MPISDPSQNYLESPPEPIDAFFHPNTVAVIGATEKAPSVGRTIGVNLLGGPLKDKTYLINPKYDTILGVPCYPDIKLVPEPIDLAIIITPAKSVPALVKDCVAANVKACIIISAGFKELGEPGIKLEHEILSYIKGSNMRIIGPNCLGVMNPVTGLNATFAASAANPGSIAFISQSGAMCTSVLDWSLSAGVGFSAFVSIGSMIDVNWGDLIQYFGKDEATKSILIYMESVGDARSFLSAAKRFALTKPIILIKAGKTQAAAKAAASHTGSLAGSDDAFQAAVSRVGVLRVDTISQMFDMAFTLDKQPLPKGPNLTLITNAGGPSVLATDQAVYSGAKMTEIDPATLTALNAFLPAAWSHSNPIDILGDAGPDTYAKTIQIVAKDPHTDGILVILTPQDMTDPTRTAEMIKPYARLDKPILASWMGGNEVANGAIALRHAGIPCFNYPDQAAEIFAKMYRHTENLKNLYATPALREVHYDSKQVDQIIAQVQKEGRSLLTEFESKQVLKSYQIPIVETILCHEAAESVKAAEGLGYPVVLKLHSETISHKTDVGGVKLNLKSKEEVKRAYEEIKESVSRLKGAEHFGGVTVQKMIKLDGYELILGSSCDPQFGPMILFGTGGQLVEVYKDSALALPPLNATHAHDLLSKTKIYHALHGVRGRKPVNIQELERILIAFSLLISNHPWISECDINPLLASPDHLIALDARIVLHENKNLIPKLAIRPYPSHYKKELKLKDNSSALIRSIMPEDEKALSDFKAVPLSERSSHDKLIQICNIDYNHDICLLALTKERKIIGICSLMRLGSSNEGQFHIAIIDSMQGKGLGTELLKHLIQIAKGEGFKKIVGLTLKENQILIKICRKLGFTLKEVGQYCELTNVF